VDDGPPLVDAHSGLKDFEGQGPKGTLLDLTEDMDLFSEDC